MILLVRPVVALLLLEQIVIQLVTVAPMTPVGVANVAEAARGAVI